MNVKSTIIRYYACDEDLNDYYKVIFIYDDGHTEESEPMLKEEALKLAEQY